MRNLKCGIPFVVVTALLASTFWGCASVPSYERLVVVVPVPYPVPCPSPPDFPAPPTTGTWPSTERFTPIDRNQDAAAPVTKTHETRPSPTPVRPLAEPVGDEPTPTRIGASGRSDGRAGGRR